MTGRFAIEPTEHELSPWPVKREGRDTIHELDRPMIAWDGEGLNLHGPDMPQSLTLFGSSTGTRVRSDAHLPCHVVLECIYNEGRNYPTARHIGFGFSYDANMIVQSLSVGKRWQLSSAGQVWVPRDQDNAWLVKFIPKKIFKVTPFSRDGSVRTAWDHAVKIDDIMTLYNGSFVTAMHQAFGCGEPPKVCRYECVPDLPQVAEGKSHRGETVGPWTDPEYVNRYHTIELGMLQRLGEKARADMYAAGFEVSSYHGPAVPARAAMKKHKIKKHMNTGTYEIKSGPLTGPYYEDNAELSVGECARYAYMAGRFEHFVVGRITGQFYAYDLRSGHPFGLTKLPTMTGRDYKFWSAARDGPVPIDPHGLYDVMILPATGEVEYKGQRMQSFKDWSLLRYMPQPLFHRRKKDHEITFPTAVRGWFYGIEVMQAQVWLHMMGATDKIGVFAGWLIENVDDLERPFTYIGDMYQQRREFKRAGNPAEWAMKLAMNSTYGLTCQSVGFDPLVKNPAETIPAYHQLEWAGWVTAHTRALLYQAALRNQLMPGELIAFETDSIMCTRELDVTIGKDLGEWSRKVYDEGFYLQSGIGVFHCVGDDDGNSCDKWEVKSRGVDADSFTVDKVRDYVRNKLGPLQPGQRWDSMPVTDTRFITLGARFPKNMSKSRLSEREDWKHCQWIPLDREINPGTGKRMHDPAVCPQCVRGVSAWDEPHWLVPKEDHENWNVPTLHPVPWLDQDWEQTIEDRLVEHGLREEEV